jgi:DNA-binding GntR family transcriptional regulator
MRIVPRKAKSPQVPQGRSLQDVIVDTRKLFDNAQEVVLETLRSAILEGVLPPGHRLRQEELAAAFGSRSRVPVREALRVLEYEGLVTSQPNRGFTVSGLDADEIEEVYDLRIVLESHAVRLALPLLTDEDLSELTILYEQMEKAPDPDTSLAKREEFYHRLYSVTARPRLTAMIVRLRQEVARSLRWKLVQHSPKHHAIFFEAIQQGDADLATAELASHYRKVASLLRRFLREDGMNQSSHGPRTDLPA